MYLIVLSIHNILRWLVIIFAVLALFRMYRGWLGRREWTKADDQAGMLFTIILDLQLLVGAILYFFLSPVTTAMLSGTLSSRGPSVTFFGLEHVLVMLAAVIVAHIGRSMAKKAPDSTAKFRRAALWFSASVLMILIAIPWPFSPISRPWLRLGSRGF